MDNLWLSLKKHFFLLCCLGCAMPVLVAAYPPMVDLPQHAAQITALREFLSGNPLFVNLFNVSFFNPYWAAYIPIFFLSRWVGIVVASKLVLFASVVMLPWSAARFLREVGVPDKYFWLLLLIPFGFSYSAGFVNFLVAIPFGFLFLARVCNCSLQEKLSFRDHIALFCWINLLFLLHMLVFLVFCALAAVIFLRTRLSFLDYLKRVSVFLYGMPILLVWMWSSSFFVASQTSEPGPWDMGWFRIVNFFPAMFGLPPTWVFLLVSVVAVVFLFITGGRLNRSWWRIAPFGVYALLMLVGPNYFLGTYYVYNRFDFLGLPLLLFAMDFGTPYWLSDRVRRLLHIGVVALVVALLGRQIFAAILYDRDTLGYQKVSALIPPGKRVLSMMIYPYDRSYVAPVFLHFPSWYQAEKAGIVDYSFANHKVMPMQYKKEPEAGRGFEWHPDSFDWTLFQGDIYDYFVIRSPKDESYLFNSAPKNRVRLVAYSEGWWLYRNMKDSQ